MLKISSGAYRSLAINNSTFKGLIEEVKSETKDAQGWASPVVLVPKLNGSIWIKFQFLESKQIGESRSFSITMYWRFSWTSWSCLISYETWHDQRELASTVRYLHCHFSVCHTWRFISFEIYDSQFKDCLATFSRLVAKLLLGLEKFCSAYLDDIFNFSNTWKEHLEHLKLVSIGLEIQDWC